MSKQTDKPVSAGSNVVGGVGNSGSMNFMDAALAALRHAGTDSADRLLSRVESEGLSSLSPEELEAVQQLVAQLKQASQRFAQLQQGDVATDAAPGDAPKEGSAAPTDSTPKEEGGNAGGEKGTGNTSAGQDAPQTGDGQKVSPTATPAEGRQATTEPGNVPGNGTAVNAAGQPTQSGGGDAPAAAAPTAPAPASMAPAAPALSGGVNSPVLGSGPGLSSGAGLSSPGPLGGGQGASAAMSSLGGGDAANIAQTMASIKQPSFNNFGIGNNLANAGQASSAELSFRVTSTSLGGSAEVANSSLMVPFVQQQVGLGGALVSQVAAPIPLSNTSGTNNTGNTSTASVGNTSIPVQMAKIEAPREVVNTTPVFTPPPPPPPPSPVGTVSIAAVAQSVVEQTSDAPTLVTFNVTRTNSLAADTVPYTITGISSADVVGGLLTGSVTFSAGQSSAIITVPVMADALIETNETLRVTIGAGQHASVAVGTATTVLTNDDFANVTVTANIGSVVEGDPGDSDGDYRVLTYTISRTAPDGTTELPADTVQWSIDSSAQGAIDISRIPQAYRSGTVSFTHGQTEATVTIHVSKDYEVEALQHVTVQTSNSTYGRPDAELGSATAEVVDDDPTVYFSGQSVEEVEGDTLVFTLRRTSGIQSALDVEYAVLPSSGLSSGLLRLLDENQLPTGTVHFAPGVQEVQISFDTIHDELVGDDEHFTVAITGVSDENGALAPTHVHASALEGTILNKDALIQGEIYNITSDPQTNVAHYTVRVYRLTALDFTHTLDYTISGSGENPLQNEGDVLSHTSGTVTFQPGQGYVDIQFDADKNEVPRGLSSFEIAFEPQDDDVILLRESIPANVVVDAVGASIRAVSAKLVEGTGNTDPHPQTFQVSLDAEADANVVIHWTVQSYNGNTPAYNASAADFGGTFPSGTVTIPAGQRTATITVTPSPDNAVEQSEFYNLAINVVSGPAVVLQSTAIGQIINDDARLGFSSDTFSADEGNLGADGVMALDVMRTGYARSTVSASWHVELIGNPNDLSNGSMEALLQHFVSGQDSLGTNNGLPSGTVELIPGQTATQILINMVGDDTVSLNKDFRVVLDNPGYGTELSDLSTATAVVMNDDALITMDAATLSVDEGQAGTTNQRIRVALHRTGDLRGTDTVEWEAVASGDHPATASTNTSGDIRSATAGNGVLARGTVTFLDGADTAYISVPVVSDDVQEYDETLTFNLVSASAGNVIDSSADHTVVTIRNDDDVVSLAGPASGTEDTRNGNTLSDGAITFTLTRTGDLTKASVINWHVANGTTSNNDFAAMGGSVTFQSGSSTAQLVVHPATDITWESDETFSVVLDSPASGTGTRLGATTSATGTITNDDVKILVQSITRAPSEGGNGEVVAHTIVLQREGDTSAASTVNWSVAGAQLLYNGSVMANALSANEFDTASGHTTSGTVSWSASDTSTKSIVVYTKGDIIVEGDEAFQLTLTAGTNDHSDLSYANGTFVVVADDDATVGIARAGAASVTEGASGSHVTVPFTVTRTGDTASTVTVHWSAAGATGIEVASGDLTFNPEGNTYDGQWVGVETQQQTLNILVDGDDNVETGENLVVTLSSPQATPHNGASANVALDGSATSATVAITNDDDKLVVSVDSSSVTEGNSSNPTVTFTITRPQVGDYNKSTTVHYRVVGNGEVQANADDFASGQESGSVPNDGLPSGTVTFAPGETSKQVTVTIHSDTDIEANEGFTLVLEAAAGNTEVVNTDAAVTILGDDQGHAVQPRIATMVEGDDGTVTNHYMIFDLVRAGDTDSAETVHWSLSGVLSGDFRANTDLSGTVTFQPGETGKSIALPLLEDSVKEEDKTAVLTMYADSSGNPGAQLASGSMTLYDDDAAVSVGFETGDESEGTPLNGSDNTYTSVTFTVNRDGNTRQLDQTTTLHWAVSGDVNADDFVDGEIPSGDLTFLAGEDSKDITLHIRRDSLKENDETLSVTLSQVSSGTENLVSSDSKDILNDDAEVAFDEDSFQVEHTEGDSGATTYTFTLVRTGYLNQTSTVDWEFIDYDGNQWDEADISDVTSINGDSSGSRWHGTVTFEGGDTPETTKTITVQVNADSGPQIPQNWPWDTVPSNLENDEAFTLQLFQHSLGTSITEGADQATGIITNDDVRIQLTDLHTNLREGALNDPLHPGNPEAIPQWITIERQGDPSQAVSIFFYLSDSNFVNGRGLAENNAWASQLADVSSEGTGITLLDLDGDNVKECGIISWAAEDVSSKKLIFTPVADDLVSGDWTFAVKVKAVPTTLHVGIQDVNYTTEHNTADYIDEIGVSATPGDDTVSRNTLDTTDNVTSGGITIATLTVKHDESGIWVSSNYIPSYDSEDNFVDYGSQQYSAHDNGDNWNNADPWDLSNHTLGDVGYNENITLEGSDRAAEAGSDYTAHSETLTFTESTRVQHVTVQLGNDNTREGFEAFSLFLDGQDSEGVTIERDRAVAEIADDEQGSSLRMHVTGGTAIESLDQYVTFKVSFGTALSHETTFHLELDSNDNDRVNLEDDLGGVGSLYFNYTLNEGVTNTVQDKVLVEYEFGHDWGEGYGNSDWLDFADLKEGQSDLHVGGYTQSLHSTWGEGEWSGDITSYDVWIPVKATAEIDYDALQVKFAGEGTMSGTFVGVADLDNYSDINEGALHFMEGQSSAYPYDYGDVQSYFNGEGCGNVKLLHFTISYDHEGDYPYGIWYVDGLDASVVEAPQQDDAFADLVLVQDLTVPAYESSYTYAIQLASDASYNENYSGMSEDWLFSQPADDTISQSFEQFVSDGVREIWMTVTREDGSSADVIPYSWNCDDIVEEAMLPGSAATRGGVCFEQGETSKTIVFLLNDDLLAENDANDSFDHYLYLNDPWDIADSIDNVAPPLLSLVPGQMEYSTDGGETWQRQPLGYDLYYSYEGNDPQVADHSTVVMTFDNEGGNSMAQWVEFSDLKAGQTNLHVGGTANPDDLWETYWTSHEGANGQTWDIWIPVKASATINSDNISIHFVGDAGMEGTFDGIADLSDTRTLNGQALNFFEAESADDIQSYFHNAGAGDVKLLKFSVTQTWDAGSYLDVIWRVDGLDVSDVVAPQDYYGPFKSLLLIDDEVLASGNSEADSYIVLDQNAQFDFTQNQLNDTYAYGTQGMLSWENTGDYVDENGYRHVDFRVTRTTDNTVADEVPYYWSVEGGNDYLSEGSADSQGVLTFSADEEYKDIHFIFEDDLELYYDNNIDVSGAQWDHRLSYVGVYDPVPVDLTIAAGVEDVMIRYKVKDDSIDEAPEDLSLTVSTTDPDFNVAGDTGTSFIIDNDSPQIHFNHEGWQSFTDSPNTDFYVEYVDINNRYGDTPDQRSADNDAGSTQGFTLTATLTGTWEVSFIQVGQMDSGDNDGAEWVQHYSTQTWVPITPEEGTYTYDLRVPAGTAQVQFRTLQDGTHSFDAEITHVDPVLVARDVQVNEDDGTATFEVVAVGGDLPTSQQDGVQVDVTTENGTWVDYTFIFSREYAAAGVQRATWVVESVGHDSALMTENDYQDYVRGYFASSELGTVTPEDFVILGDQQADGTTGMPRGTVTFADGQKEATVVIRVRADAVGEQNEEFRVRLVDALDGAQVLGNPDAPFTYASRFDYSGYGRITNDDPVFSIVEGKVLNEHINQEDTPTAPAGYTLHTFTVHRDGDATEAVTVDWSLEVSGGDSDLFTSGNLLDVMSDDANMLATSSDFYSTPGNAYSLAWVSEQPSNGLMRSVGKTILFAPGTTDVTVTFAVRDDATIEKAEAFRAVLSNAQPSPGSEVTPGISATKGYADFLIGDNDGTKVSVAISTYEYNGSDLVRTTGVDPVTDEDMVQEGTTQATKNQIKLTFTRTGDLSEATQASFEVTGLGDQNNSGMTKASVSSGDVVWIGSPNYIWRGVVDFAQNASTATVIFDVTDDNFVERDESVTVTLFDFEHLPESFMGPNYTYGGTVNGPTIGESGTLPDWGHSIRDPDAYTDTVVVKNDDVRLWLTDFSNTWNYNNNGVGVYHFQTPENERPSLGEVAEGDGGATNDLSLTFARAGRQDNSITLSWHIVHGTTDDADFNSAFLSGGVIGGTLTLPGTDDDVQADDYATQSFILQDLFSPDYDPEENETFQIVFTSQDTKNVKFTYDFVNEEYASSNWLSGAVDRTASTTMTVDCSILNDDVVYSIDNTANTSNGVCSVVEGASGSATDFTFDVHRVVDSSDGDVTGGYEYGSMVHWRVVTDSPSHPVNASDFVLLDGQSAGGNGLPSGTVSFAGGETPDVLKSITLRVRGDASVEYGENFKIELYNPSIGHVDGDNGSVNAIIVNDDTGISINDVVVAEGDTSGGTTVSFTVTRSGELNHQSTANWNKYDIETDSVDFTGSTSGSLTFNATTSGMVYGYGEETQQIQLTINGDSTPEEDQDFRVQLSRITGISDIVDRVGVATLQNDDATFSVAVKNGTSASHVEGDGQPYTFTITRSNDTVQAQTVTWSVVGAGGRNVVDSTDFSGSLQSGSVTFNPGELSKDITVTGSSSDNTAEGDERFAVRIALGAGTANDTIDTNDAVGVVVNDDAAIFINDSKAVIQREGTGGSAIYEFDVTRSGPVSGTQTVHWALALDGTASANDFTGPTSGDLSFSGNGTQTVSVGLATDPTMESNETFHIVLSNNAYIVSSTNNALGTIGDDDYTLAVADTQVSEGDGRKSISFVFTRTGSDALPVSVSWSVAAGTANAQDFPAGVLPSGTFTMPANTSSYTLSVPIQGDVLKELDETFTLNASYDGHNISATGTLQNDDEEFTIDAITPVLEGSVGTPGQFDITIHRSGVTTGTSLVTWTIEGSGTHPASASDFDAVTGDLTFDDGETQKVVTVTLVGNSTAEFDKGFTVSLTDPGPGSSVSASAGSVQSSILNDDLAWYVTAASSTVTEGDGNSGVVYMDWTVTRSGGDLSQSHTIDWSLSGINANDATSQSDDFQSLSQTSGTLTFAAQETSKTVRFQVMNDNLVETASTPITITLASPSAGTILTSTSQVSLLDTDDAFAIEATSVDRNESNSGTVAYTYEVMRTGNLDKASSVTWTAAGYGSHALSTDEFQGTTTGILTFEPGDSGPQIVTVYVKGDTVGEYDEQFRVTLSNAADGSNLDTSYATNTILNDDPVLTLTMSNTSIEEGGEQDDRAITFTITRSGSTAGSAQVQWSITSDGGDYAVNAEDFGGSLPSGVVIFSPGQTAKTVTVLTSGDFVCENNESFNVVLSNPVNATILQGEANATLINDDTSIELSGNTEVQEGDEGDEAEFQFTLNAYGTADHVEVHWHLEATGNHPVSDSDIVGGLVTDQVATIWLDSDSHEGSENIQISVSGDNIPGYSVSGNTFQAYDETFRFVVDEVIAYDRFDNLVGASVTTDSSMVATVLDDDSVIRFAPLDEDYVDTITEDNSGTHALTFVVTRAGSSDLALDREVTVDYSVLSQFANEADQSDFAGSTLPSGTVTFAAHQETATITVLVNGDTQVEGNEKFTLQLSNPSEGAAISGSGALAQGTILSDDMGLTINCPITSATESTARFTFDIVRSGAVGQSIDVDYNIGTPSQTVHDNQTGVSASDFVSGTQLSGTIHFDAGQTSARFVVEATNDSTAEANEHFAFEVEYGQNASDVIDCTIVNDDAGTVTPPVDQLDVVPHAA